MGKEIEYKKCQGKCGQIYPATPEFFHTVGHWNKKEHRKKYYLRGICKVCRNKKGREDSLNNASYLKAARVVYKEMKREGVQV